MQKKFKNFDQSLSVKLAATLVLMAPNSNTYIRMKAEYMCQQPILRKLKNHAQFFQNKQKFENFQNF